MKERELRIASSAKKEMAEILQYRKLAELKDPLFSQGLITITDVKVEKGMHHIRFFLSAYQHPTPELLEKALNKAAHSIKGELSRRLKMRLTPSVSFHIGDSIERSFEVEKILDDIRREEVKKEED